MIQIHQSLFSPHPGADPSGRASQAQARRTSNKGNVRHGRQRRHDAPKFLNGFVCFGLVVDRVCRDPHKQGKRGPAPRWRNPRKPAKTIIHINRHKIRHNQKHQQKEAVITVKKGNTNLYGHEVEIPGGCRVVYRPDNPICCGARVWIESLYEVQVISLAL